MSQGKAWECTELQGQRMALIGKGIDELRAAMERQRSVTLWNTFLMRKEKQHETV